MTIFITFLMIFRPTFQQEIKSSIIVQSQTVKYTRDELLSLRPNVTCKPDAEIPKELKARKRGRKGGVYNRIKKRGQRVPLPIVITGNTQSLNNKMDELQGCVKYFSEYRHASLLGFTETWLTQHSTGVDIDGFYCVRGDRTSESGKKSGGGLCLYVNERYCHPSNVYQTAHQCNPDVEILAVTLRPYYLPREIPKVVVILVYVPPSGSDDAAAEAVAEVVHQQQTKSPDGAVLLMGDFNTCDMDTQLPDFTQYVNCPTRGQKTLDKFYCNVKNAYKCERMTGLGKSDHCMLRLLPMYKSKLKSMPIVRKTVKVWDETSCDSLKGCFECTDWDMFFESCKDVEELNDVVSEYVKFCESVCVKTKEIKCFPNNKPWVTKDIKHSINAKNIAYASKDKTKIFEAQKKLDEKIREGKEKYREKISQSFKSNNMRDVWDQMKSVICCDKTKTQITVDDGQTYADELNDFYARFDADSTPDENSRFKSDNLTCFSDDAPTFHPDDTRKVFNSLKLNKSHGPDNVTPKLLKTCSSQLAVPFTEIFNSSIRQHKLPLIWRTSEIVPVPKRQKVSTLNDLRPVALTSVLVKCMEKLVLRFLLPCVEPFQDPYQFAYKSKRSVDDAVSVFTNHIYSHVDTPKAYCRTLFVDFSSAFNTIQPKILIQKLLKMNINKHLCAWIFEFLTNRPQYVRFQLNTTVFYSSNRIINIGSPQGTCISPALFTIYTDDCRSESDIVKIVKFADDTAILGLLNESTTSFCTFLEEIERFVSWCTRHSLQLNVNKTKDMIFDFRKKECSHSAIEIGDKFVERVRDYKYLGVTVNEKLDWGVHAETVLSKVNQRMYFVRKLSAFGIDTVLVSLFYRAAVQSLFSFCVIVWGGNLACKECKRFDRVAKRVSRMTEISQDSFKQILDKFCIRKINSILKDSQHPLYSHISFSARSNRIILIRTKRERFRNSFLPYAVRLYSKNYERQGK